MSGMRNLRFAVRLLVRQPLFTLTAVLSIAIGIGANTAIFTAVNGLLLASPEGVADHARLVDIGRTRDGRGFDTVGYQTYADVRDRAAGFAGILGYTLEPRPLSLSSGGGAEGIFGQQVSDNYFEVLGVRPFLGRLFATGDDKLGVKNPIIVLSHQFWQRRFQSDASIVGQTLTINGEPFQVAGVTPPGFIGTSVMSQDVFVPMTAMARGMADDELLRSRQSHWMMMIGRLAPGGSIAQAQSGLDAVMAQLETEYPDVYKNRGLQARPAGRIPGMSGIIGGFMAVLMGLVGLVLLIACVNLAGMQLARATSRSREIAVRLALGAARRQLVAQLMLESLLLCAAGGALGFLIGGWMLGGLMGLLPPLPVPIAFRFDPDLRVLLFTTGASLLAGLATGLAPALQSTRPDLVPALKDDARAPAKLRMRHVFVGGQLALSIVLLLAGTLLLRAFKSAVDIDPGFDPAHIVTASIDLRIAGYTDETSQPFYRQLLEGLGRIPGASRVAIAAQVPLGGSRLGLGSIRIPERQNERFDADWNVVSPGFFETLKMPIVQGRAFTDADRAGAPRVAIINESFARAAWPGESAIGRKLDMDQGDAEVIGVARDARLHIIGNRPVPFIFVPLYQNPMLRTEIFVRHHDSVTMAAIAPGVRQTVRAINPYLPVGSTSDLAAIAAFGMVPQRLAATLVGALGLAGLLLAAIGLYGLMAYAVASRRREIGIRQALGADAATIVRMFVRQGMKLALIGSGIGTVLGIAVAFGIRSLLLGISPLDPIALSATIGAMLAVGLAASYLPARRASSIAPLNALRSE